MLHHVPSEELKAFVILAEEYGVIFFSLLESLDGLSSHGLDLLVHSLELFVILQC